jgi:ABC-2 type transport system permease protein
MLDIVRKDLRLGPRSPIFLWVLILPVLITLVLQLAFGSLFDPEPRLGIVDLGSSEITAAAGALDGIELTVVDDEETLLRMVEDNDLDGGLVLPAGFDDQLRAGDRPVLELYVGGESIASDRIVLAVTALDLVRGVEGSAPPVAIDVTSFGEEQLPVSLRLIPAIVTYALVVAAVFLPSFSLADEREHGTIRALAISPARLSEIVAAKGVVGFLLAIPMAVFTLWLNGALKVQALPLVVVLVVGGLMMVEIGLIYGTAAANVTGVFTLIKGTGVLLLGPSIFYIFPDWPAWIAKVFPTYWVINPIFEVTVGGSGLNGIWTELGIALGIIAVLLVPLGLLTRRLSRRLALG